MNPSTPPDPQTEQPVLPYAAQRRLTAAGWILIGFGAIGVAAALGSLTASSGINPLRLYAFVVAVSVGSIGASVLRAAAVWKWNIAAHAEQSRRLDRIERAHAEQSQASVRSEAAIDALAQLVTALHETVKQAQAKGYLADVRQRLGDDGGGGGGAKVLHMSETGREQRMIVPDSPR